ncbi:hypothetical protein BU16DRAFT_566650 [Lophium mytilinum]|uniref:Uncharacterized protein n=1 Tax=Lophium mytilinum TaxID=390894 RepID=A0A6A6QGN8_9PEZI|nr:hypothetical protein BU16DRAFT_566650 [Lophium mytilinum]
MIEPKSTDERQRAHDAPAREWSKYVDEVMTGFGECDIRKDEATLSGKFDIPALIANYSVALRNAPSTYFEKDRGPLAEFDLERLEDVSRMIDACNEKLHGVMKDLDSRLTSVPSRIREPNPFSFSSHLSYLNKIRYDKEEKLSDKILGSVNMRRLESRPVQYEMKLAIRPYGMAGEQAPKSSTNVPMPANTLAGAKSNSSSQRQASFARKQDERDSVHHGHKDPSGLTPLWLSQPQLHFQKPLSTTVVFSTHGKNYAATTEKPRGRELPQSPTREPQASVVSYTQPKSRQQMMFEMDMNLAPGRPPYSERRNRFLGAPVAPSNQSTLEASSSRAHEIARKLNLGSEAKTRSRDFGPRSSIRRTRLLAENQHDQFSSEIGEKRMGQGSDHAMRRTVLVSPTRDRRSKEPDLFLISGKDIYRPSHMEDVETDDLEELLIDIISEKIIGPIF